MSLIPGNLFLELIDDALKRAKGQFVNMRIGRRLPNPRLVPLLQLPKPFASLRQFLIVLQSHRVTSSIRVLTNRLGPLETVKGVPTDPVSHVAVRLGENIADSSYNPLVEVTTSERR